jgi:hypothetical protein
LGTLRRVRDGPARTVREEGHDGGRADRAAVGEEEIGGGIRGEPNPQRAVGDRPGFGEGASRIGDDLALTAGPDAGDAGGADTERHVPEHEVGQVPDDTFALPDRPRPPV